MLSVRTPNAAARCSVHRFEEAEFYTCGAGLVGDLRVGRPQQWLWYVVHRWRGKPHCPTSHTERRRVGPVAQCVPTLEAVQVLFLSPRTKIDKLPSANASKTWHTIVLPFSTTMQLEGSAAAEAVWRRRDWHGAVGLCPAVHQSSSPFSWYPRVMNTRW